jgi:hypothetical protein
MSRLDPRIVQQNRKAWFRDQGLEVKNQEISDREMDVAAWLHLCPEVGVLNKEDGTRAYYRIINGETVYIKEMW